MAEKGLKIKITAEAKDAKAKLKELANESAAETKRIAQQFKLLKTVQKEDEKRFSDYKKSLAKQETESIKAAEKERQIARKQSIEAEKQAAKNIQSIQKNKDLERSTKIKSFTGSPVEVERLKFALRALGNENVRLFATTNQLTTATNKERQSFSENQKEIDRLKKSLRDLQGVSKGFTGKSPLSGLQLLEAGENITVIFAGLKAAISQTTQTLGSFITEANKLQSANLGLESIAKFKGVDTNAATKSIQNLALVKNGLLTVGDASLALKNLLATGFSLDESIKLIEGFGDAAAFGRQSSLEFGYAITSATEGIKNQNSILVDNAGVTKNLSVILKEAGYSAQDLQNVTTDLNVRQALYNGLLKETSAQLGDAEKLTKTFAGQQAKLEAQITTLKQEFGQTIQKAILPFITSLTNADEGTRKFAGGIAVAGNSVITLIPLIAQLNLAFPKLGSAAVSAGSRIAATFGAGGPVVIAIGIALYGVVELIDRMKEAQREADQLARFQEKQRQNQTVNLYDPNNPGLETINKYKKILEDDPKKEITVNGKVLQLKEYIAELEKANSTANSYGANVYYQNQEQVKFNQTLDAANEKVSELKKSLSSYSGNKEGLTKLQQELKSATAEAEKLNKEIFPETEKSSGTGKGKGNDEKKEDLLFLKDIEKQIDDIDLKISKQSFAENYVEGLFGKKADLENIKSFISDITNNIEILSNKNLQFQSLTTGKTSIPEIQLTETQRIEIAGAENERLRSQQEAHLNLIESTYSTALTESQNIANILFGGADNFASEFLGAIEDGISLSKSFASILSLIFGGGGGGGGIFSIIGSIFGGGGDSAGLSPVNFIDPGSSSSQSPESFIADSRISGNDIVTSYRRTTNIESKLLT